MKVQQQIEDLIIFLIVLLYLNFFSLTSIPDESFLKSNALYLMGLGMMGSTIIIFLFKKNVEKKPLDKLVFFLILFMAISSVSAYVYWEQPFMFSLKSYAFFFIYFLYFLMILLEVSPERVEKIMKVFFFCSLVVFFIDFTTFPNPLFSWRSEERRAGITILFYGQGFTFLGAFYYLNRFFKTKKIIDLSWYLVSFFCLFFLTQSRMNLLALVSVFFYNLLVSDVKQKSLITVLLITGAVVFYFTSSTFDGIKEDNAEQSQNIKEDIRVSAEKHFLFELQAGVPTMIFGNGVPADRTALGFESMKANEKGYFTADVGLTGIFSYFGILGVIAWLLFFYSAFKIKPSERSTYIKGYFLTLLTTAVVAFSIFEPGYMPATVFCLYLLRYENNDKQEPEYEYHGA